VCVEAVDPRGLHESRLESDPLTLATLADSRLVFAGSASSVDITRGIVRVLVARVADWCLIAPRPPPHADAIAVLAIRRSGSGLDEVLAARGPGLALAPAGIGSLLPAIEARWGEGADLVLDASGRTLELPTGPFGVLGLGGGRLRFGSLIVARAPGRPGFTPSERDLIHRVVAEVSAALENTELARSAERAALARDTVVDVVVHDLATPLNAVELLFERIALAADQPDGTARIHDYVDAARRSLGQVERLLADLADVRDIEQGMFSADLSTQAVCDILTVAIDQVGPLARDQEVRIDLVGGACPLRVQADPARVVQLLVNLMKNGIRVSPRGGAVEVVPRRVGDRAEITVVDHGPGIPSDRLPHLFDRFARARGHDGSRRGLGLMIAQEVARAHGDCIRVETALGRGSRFTFSLALAEETGTASICSRE
jgi:signal transduction histidine kinase